MSEKIKNQVYFKSDNFWGVPLLDKKGLITKKHFKNMDNLFTVAKKIVPKIFNTKDRSKLIYLTLFRKSDINYLLDNGIKPDNIIVHFLTTDDIIERFWTKKTFNNNCEWLWEKGIKYLVEPDFSAWINMPRIVQFFQRYRSATVGKDFQEYGFKVIPNICFTDTQSYDYMMLGYPQKMPYALIDINHSEDNKISLSLYQTGLQKIYDNFDIDTIIIYGGTKKLIRNLYPIIKKFKNYKHVLSRNDILRSTFHNTLKEVSENGKGSKWKTTTDDKSV